MQATPRVRSIVLKEAFVIALVAMLMNGCSARPVRFQDHPHGDFVSHMAAAPDAARAPGNDQRRAG